MRTIFIADAHLQHQNDPPYQAMLRFLSEITGNCSTLYIMGDFFEFWLGYPKTIPYTHYLPLLDALHLLHREGARIVYFEGNHDFHMGPYFTKTLQAEVFPGPASLRINGQNAFLCHGDQANPDDIPYKILRAIFHSALTGWLPNIVPPSVPNYIAERMGRKGRTNIKAKGENPEHRKILRKYANEQFAKGYDLVIAGHFHLPFIENPAEYPEKQLISLGDWATRLSYAELVEGEIIIRNFP
jgi:UDP-2,3-diacylglucosamine hydrolase